MSPTARPPITIFLVLIAGLYLPFLNQAFHIDDTNFLIMAEGALLDPWRPHDIIINWLGTPQRAFDVLSNPPGIAYVLSIVKLLGGSEVLSHLALLPFTGLSAWGVWRLAQRFDAPPLLTTCLWLVSPAVVISAHTVMPDMALAACYIAGLAITIEGVDRGRLHHAMAGATLLGMAAMFRYSGLTGAPLLLLYLALNHRRSHFGFKRSGLVMVAWIAAPLLWALHDIHAYGRWHFWHMIAFQSAGDVAMGAGQQALTQLLFMGGVAVLPLIPLLLERVAPGTPPWRRKLGPIAAVAPVAIGVASGLGSDPNTGLLWGCGAAFLITSVWLLSLVLTFVNGSRRPNRLAGGMRLPSADASFLACWILGILVFNQALRFVSARYLLLAIPPLLILVAPTLAPGWKSRALIGLTAGLSLILSTSDALMAEVYRDASARLPSSDRPISFAGHWGLQHYLMERGGTPTVDGALPPVGSTFVLATAPWPQEMSGANWRLESPKVWYYQHMLPFRTHSLRPAACFYASAVASTSPHGRPSWQNQIEAAEGTQLDTGMPLLKLTQFDLTSQASGLLSPEEAQNAQRAWLPWTLSTSQTVDAILVGQIKASK